MDRVQILEGEWRGFIGWVTQIDMRTVTVHDGVFSVIVPSSIKFKEFTGIDLTKDRRES